MDSQWRRFDRGKSASCPQGADSGEVRSPLVTVVIPAYNAEATIDETLLSVRGQSYRNLEILVVDDGSTDATAARVAEQMRDDDRIRIIRQTNAGVAAARNRGVAESRGEFIAPIDADDLWRPAKIARQMTAMLAGGEKVGLVYTWHAIIDKRSRILTIGRRAFHEGRVLEELLRRNFIGNGSTPLMRKTAILQAGGYDPSLRANHAQGCEDLKLYLHIAERYEFASVNECLTGYRRLPSNMSSDFLQMLRSNEIVFAEFRDKYPQYARVIAEGLAHARRWLFIGAVRTRSPRSMAVLTVEILKYDPLYLLEYLGTRLSRKPYHWLKRRLERLAGIDKGDRALPFLPLQEWSKLQTPGPRG